MRVLISDAQEAAVDEEAAGAELVLLDTDDDPDEARAEEIETLLDAREAELETSEIEDIEVDDLEIDVEAEDDTDREVESDTDKELTLEEELDDRAEEEDDDEAIDEEGVTTTPFTFRGMLRAPSPVDRYSAILFHCPQFWPALLGHGLEQN